ncbi:hypothetical protein RFI_39437, partial [Reticulomyxa filosa]
MSQSEIENFRQRLKNKGIDLKALHIVSFQCTQNSKAFRIKERWNQAMSHSESKFVKPLLLLDEIGLAEHSKHSPLKVLHHLLENPKILFIGLSNWPLDAAKMNRVIVHQIPNNLDADLKAIGEAIYKTKYTSLKQGDIDMLVDVFKELNKQISKQKLPLCKENWLGRRDFYALIRHYMHKPVPRESFQGIMRNLGGYRDPQFQKCLAEALEKVFRKSAKEISALMSDWGSLKCVEMNLQDKDCRHCMLVCEKPYSWQLLLDHNLLSCEDAVFLFESKFASDTATMTSYDHLHKVINCMQVGKKVVLYKLKSIHECLYDMLNQRYSTDSSKIALSQKNLNVSLLSPKKIWRIQLHHTLNNLANLFLICLSFVVFTKREKAFFGRFERQHISYIGSLSPSDFEKVDIFKKYLCNRYGLFRKKELPELFCGFNDDTIPSAILHILLQQGNRDNEDIKQDETEQLLELFYPLCHPAKIVGLTMCSPPRNVNYTDRSFGTFEQVLDTAKKNSKKEMLLILTCDLEYNSFQRKWNSKRIRDYMKVSHLEKDVTNFFESSMMDMLVLQYQHKTDDLTQFFQIKCILESAHSLYWNKSNNKKPAKKKLVVLIVHNVMGQKDPFPIIFSHIPRLSEFAFIFSLNIHVHIPKSFFFLCLCLNQMQRLIRRAFFYLEFPSSLIPSLELKVDLVPTEIQDLMVERLKLVLKKNIPINYFINKIKQEAEQTMKRQNESQPSFFQTYQIT